MCDGCEVNQKYYRYAITEPTQEDCLLASLCIPTQTEIRQRMGSKLAEVFFENLSSEGQILLGLQPPLTGPNDVWINPSSRLKNKVRCKPVPEPTVLHQKAFTHQAILELGERYIESLTLTLRRQIEESLKAQAEDHEAECNKRLAEALENAKVQADEQCMEVVGTLMEHFDRCFSEMVEKSKLRMRKECQFRVQEERAELASYLLMQLQFEVEKRDLELCSDFYDTLYGELNCLSAKYEKQIELVSRAERKVAREVLEEIVENYERQLMNLRSEMEVSNMIDICRAIKEEKEKHDRESREIQAEIKRQIGLLAKWVLDLKNRNKTLQAMATERAKRIKKYEKKTRVLIEEFQKFVNFALKAAPGHSEFLLSMQKMVLKTYYEDSLLRPEDFEAYKNCITGKADKEEEETEAKLPRNELRICLQNKKKQEEEEVKEEGEKAGKDNGGKCKDSRASKYAFNYHRFKYNLLKNLIKGIKFQSGVDKCASKEQPREERAETPGEEESEDECPEELDEGLMEAMANYKQNLILVGENAKEHMQPLGAFLQERMRTIYDLLKDDPELRTMVLDSMPVDRSGSTDTLFSMFKKIC